MSINHKKGVFHFEIWNSCISCNSSHDVESIDELKVPKGYEEYYSSCIIHEEKIAGLWEWIISGLRESAWKLQSLPPENSKCHWQLRRRQNIPWLPTSALNFPKRLWMEINVGCAIRISSRRSLPFSPGKTPAIFLEQWLVTWIFFITSVLMLLLLLLALTLSFSQMYRHKKLLEVFFRR